MRRLYVCLTLEAEIAKSRGLVSLMLGRADLFSPEEIALQMQLSRMLEQAQAHAVRLVNSVLEHSGSVDIHDLVDYHLEERLKTIGVPDGEVLSK